MKERDAVETAQKEIQSVSTDRGIGFENEIYTRRFSEVEEQTRDATWNVLVRDYFQGYVSPDDVVVDIGAGDGLFIKKIKAGRKIAVDLSPHVQMLKEHNIEVYQLPADQFAQEIGCKADVIFMSNFCEHLPDKRTLLQVFEECYQALKPGGSIVILQPNIRLVGTAYWDYVDHHIPLTEHSLIEGLEVSGFNVVKVIPRFLPYTAKSTLGRLISGQNVERMAETYLKFPILWRLFGKQSLVVATPRAV